MINILCVLNWQIGHRGRQWQCESLAFVLMKLLPPWTQTDPDISPAELNCLSMIVMIVTSPYWLWSGMVCNLVERHHDKRLASEGSGEATMVRLLAVAHVTRDRSLVTSSWSHASGPILGLIQTNLRFPELMWKFVWWVPYWKWWVSMANGLNFQNATGYQTDGHDEHDEQQEIQALQHIVGRDQSLLYHILVGWASTEHP